MSDNPFALSNIEPQQDSAPASDNPFALGAIQRDQRQDLRVNLESAVRTNPQQAAEAARLAKKYETPDEVLLRNLQDVKLRDAVAEADKKLQTSPRLADYMRTSPFALKQAHDDLDNLIKINGELKAWNGPEPTARNIVSGLAQSLPQGFRSMRAGMQAQMGDFLEWTGLVAPDPVYKADQQRKLAQAVGAKDFTTPNFESSTASAIYGGVDSTLRMLPGLAGSVATRSSVPLMASIGVQTQAEAYGKYRARGGTPLEALAGGTGEAAVEVVTEMPAMKFLTGALGRTGAGEFVSGLLARELPMEQVATFLQDAIDTAVANPDKTWEQFVAERPGAAYETLISTLTQSAIMGGVSEGARRLTKQANDQNAAQAQVQKLTAAMQAAEASTLRTNNPDEFRAVMEHLAQDGKVYVDAQVLNQLPPEQLQALGVAESLPEALAANSSVEVKLSDLLTHAPGTPAAQVLIDNARATPDGLSAIEAQQASDQAGEFIKTEAERVLAEAQDATAWQDSTNKVKQGVLDQLNSAGRFSPEVNEAYATLQSSFFSVMAQRLGTTPEELFARYNLRVEAKLPGQGERLDQVTPEHPLDNDLQTAVQSAFTGAGGVGAIEDSTDIYAKSKAFAEMAKREGYAVSDEGAKYFRVFKTIGTDADGYPREISLNVRVSDHSNVNRGSHFGDTVINIAPDDGYARDSFASALWKLRNADVNEALDTTIAGRPSDEFAFYQSTEQPRLMAVHNLPGQGERLDQGGDVGLALNTLTRDDLEDDQVFSKPLPDVDSEDLGYVKKLGANSVGSGGFHVYVKGEDVREAGPHEFYFYDNSDEPIGFARLTKTRDQASVNMIAFTEDARGSGYGKAFYKYLLDELGVSVKSDKEITEGTAALYRSLAKEYGASVDSDGRVVISKQLNQSAEQPRLMAVHNLSAENLIFADKMGGLAVPSIGVVTQDAGAVDGFGEITLIGRKGLVDPKQERVFSADAYTVRFPKPEWPKVKSKDAQALVDFVRAAAKEFDDGGLTGETWDNMVNTPDAAKVVEKWTYSSAVKAMFLREKGVDVQPAMRPVRTTSGLTVEQFEALRPLYEQVSKQHDEGQYGTPEEAELKQRVEDGLRETYAELGKRDVMVDKMVEKATYRLVDTLYSDARAVQTGPTVDTWDTGKKINEQIEPYAIEFKQWVESKIIPKFGDPFIKVGGKKAPYTLDNIVKTMTDTKVKGKEKTMTYGAGQVRAAASVEFSDLEQMRAAAVENVVDPAQYEAAKAETEKKLEDYRSAVVEFTNVTNWKGDPDTWEALDASMRALAKWSTGKKRDAASMKAALRAEDFNVAKIPDSVIEQAMDAAGALLRAPVPYFEAKPQRAVSLGEFAGAVIPTDAPQQVRDILAKNNVPVTEYEPGADRTSTAREFAAQLAGQGQDTLFQTATPAPTSLPDTIEVDGKQRSTTNSNGQPIAATEEGVRNFWKWFGDSKVVDASGKPLVVYHGTGSDFDVFDESAPAAHWKMDGFYFAQKPADASRFAESSAKIKQNRLGNAFRPDGANVMPVYLSLQNPKVIEFSRRGQGGFVAADEMREILAEAKFDGHDGAIIKGWQDGSGEVQYVAFRPEQIKSAIGNSGEFDPSNPSILAQNSQAPRGTYSPSQVLITLGESADLSTFLHESGHFFLEVMADLASQANAPQQIRDNMDKLLAWFGIKGDEVVGGADSGGELAQKIDQTETPEFKNWFGDSQAREPMVSSKQKLADMPPLRMYHTTRNADFDVFEANRPTINSTTFGDVETSRAAMFFTPSVEDSNAYGKLSDGRAVKGAATVPVYLRAQDPLYLTDGIEEVDAQRLIEAGMSSRFVYNALGNWAMFDDEGGKELVETLKAAGYDSVVFNDENPITGEAFEAWAVFDPAQIKSAIGNSGAFDPNNPSILAQDGNLPTDNTQPAGRTPLEVWNAMTLDQKRPHHERFAESFEAYLLEGKAPSAELQPLFRKFRSWLVNVYKSLSEFMRGRNLDISPEIRQVFDRMLATDEQIRQAEDAAGMLPDFDATNEAIEKLQARSLRDLKWTVGARSKALKALQREAANLRKAVKAEVTAEVEQMPEFKAQREIAEFKRENKRKANGVELAIIAEANGFESADAMTKAIDLVGKKADMIEGKTDQRMLENFGELATPEALEAAANDAVHNEARARALATELKAQADMLNPRQDTGRTASNGRAITVNALTEAAKQFAQNLTARRRVKDLKNAAWQHRSAESRAAKAWQEATAKGKTEEAVAAKRDQLLNNYTAKAMGEAQAEVRKVLEFFAKVTKGNNEKLVDKGRDPDVVNAARAVLAAYDIAPRLEKTANDYMEAVAKYDAQMYGALKPGLDAMLANAKPFGELTVDEMRALRDEIGSMWELAKTSRQMEIDGDRVDIDDAAQDLVNRMVEIGVPDEIPGEKGAITNRQELGIKLQFAKAILSRVEQWAERMDGKFGGPFLRYVFQPVKDAADRYRTARVQHREKFTKLVEGVAPFIKPGPIAAPELGYTFGNARDSGMAELLHALIHTGNDSNKRKLLLGRNWATENADGTLDTTRWDTFVARLISEGTLRKEHYDFAQGVWDLLEETKPLAQEAHRKVFGRYFAEVTANEFTTPFGVYRGGYAPAQTDSRLVGDAKLRELAEGENESMAYAFPSAPSGFTKSRVEYNKPLLLDLRALAQHMDKVLLFSHMQPAIADARRLLTRKNVSYALDRIDPGAYEGMIMPWLNRSAKQIVETPIAGDRRISRFMGAVRSRAGMALMMANLSNTVQQITGFSTAAIKVKPSLMLKAVGQFTASPKEFKRSVAEASAYMKDRMLNEVSTMNDAVEQILVDPTLLEKGQAWTQKHAYFLQSAVDNTMSPIIWTAAYNQAIEEGSEARDAVRFADGVIRQTQGSTLPEDVSRFETGDARARFFTQFIGYFNMMANTNATAVSQIANEMGLRKGAGKLLYTALVGLLVPIWVAEAIAQAFRGGPGDEDDDGYLDDWLMAVFGLGTLRGMTAQIPIAGQVGQMAVSRFNNNPADDKFSLSPAVSLIESAVGSPASVYKAIIEDGNAQKAVRDVAAAATLLTGLPFYAAARPVGYAAGVAQGKIEPTDAVDAVRGTVTGTASKESKTP